MRIARATLAITVALTLLLTAACGVKEAPAGSSSAGKSGGAPASKLDEAWQELSNAAQQPSASLEDVRLPKAPPGFTHADVRVLADRLIELMQRSTMKGLSGMSADRAVNTAFARFPHDTLTQLRESLRPLEQKGFAWQWAVASRFPKTAQVSDPKFLGSEMAATTFPSDKGTFLRVYLRSFIKNDVSVEDETRTVVVQRKILIQSLNPRSFDPAWWPAVGFSFDIYGVDRCGFKENVVRPSKDIDVIRKDATRLSKAIAKKVDVHPGVMSKKDFAGLKHSVAKC